jgi:hypothetical protein
MLISLSAHPGSGACSLRRARVRRRTRVQRRRDKRPFVMTYSFLQKFLRVGFAAEFVLTRHRLFRQTCLYGGRNRRKIAV